MPLDIRALGEGLKGNPLKTLGSNLTDTLNRGQGNYLTPDILYDDRSRSPISPNGIRKREKIIWRIPSVGLVPMYINPQQLRITEKKIISKQRTKGGYIIQYWGEELPSITLEGHTGSSGVDGINILRSIYRAEQNSFQSVAQLLTDKLREFTNTSGGATGKATAGSSGKAISKVLGSGPNPPLLPTLASLAASVQLFYQGWVFKGFFEEFTVTESVVNGVGVFNYTMTFTVLDRRGQRNNFMPWHRDPGLNPGGFGPGSDLDWYNHSDGENTPMSFGGQKGK